MDTPPIARRQGGVLDRGQALDAGVTAAQIRWRVRRGRWQVLHRGVYFTNAGVVPWQARAWAALIWSGPGAALVLDAAARVWRLRPDDPPVVAVGVPPGRRVMTTPGVEVIRRRRLVVRRVDGLPVTTAAQTVIDLAGLRSVSADDAVALAAKACQSGRVSAAALLAELQQRERHRHGSVLRLALGDIGAGAESLPEVWFAARVLRPHALPEFERQVVEVAGTRTDLKNTEFGVNVEIDGRAWHAGEAFHSDRRRDRAAAARGEVTVRVSFLDLRQDPCDVAADLGATLGRRGWSGAPTPCRSCRAIA